MCTSNSVLASYMYDVLGVLAITMVLTCIRVLIRKLSLNARSTHTPVHADSVQKIVAPPTYVMLLLSGGTVVNVVR
jgi:hypothetical protein